MKNRASAFGIPRFGTSRRAAVLGAALLAAAAMLPGAARTQPAPLKVGQFLDITGGGASAAEAAKLGIDMAVQEINAAGGIAGRPLVMLMADTQTDPTVGVGEIKRLVLQEKVELVFGPLISQVLLAVLPVVNEAKIPQFGATGSELITPKAAPYYFSVLINAESQAKAMVNQAVQVLGAKSGAIISDSGAQSKSFVEAMRREMEARGMKLTGTQEYQYRATDMTPQILALKRGNPDTLFLFSSSGEDAGNVLRARDDLGWNPKVTGNYTVATFAEAIIKVAGKEALHDTTGLNYTAFTYCDANQLPKPFVDFVSRAKAFSPDKAARLSMTFAATVYDGVFVLKEAVEGTGGKTDGPTVAAWIEANGGKHTGILGSLSPSATSHFLVGPDALSAVLPASLISGGLQQRFRCP
jgi:ABC-type branched-subunit amino acid transport system substrate-binding protein